MVIGAGPAGCAFALRCAATGIRVALIEKSRFPRIQPGETLHPGVEPLFASLGVLERILDAGFHRHRGVWVEWDGPRAFHSYGQDTRGPWRGFQADRAKLDTLLLDAAREAGVEVFQPCRAYELICDSAGNIIGLQTSDGPMPARWVVDASGRHSWLAKQLGLEFEYHGPSLRVRFGWTSRRCHQADGQPSLQAHPHGWNWFAPLGARRSAWVDLRLPSIGHAANSGGEAGARRPENGIDMRWRLLPECAGTGYFVLGDAAATLDPSSSHGVLRALMSGMLTSHLLSGVNGGSLASAAATAAYRDWMLAQFTHDTAALRKLWQRHPSAKIRREMSLRSKANETGSPNSLVYRGRKNSDVRGTTIPSQSHARARPFEGATVEGNG